MKSLGANFNLNIKFSLQADLWVQILCIIMRFLKHHGFKCTSYTHNNDNLEVNAVLKMALHHPLGYSKEKLWLLESFLRSPLYRLSNCFTTTAVKQLSKNCSYWEDVSSNLTAPIKKPLVNSSTGAYKLRFYTNK